MVYNKVGDCLYLFSLANIYIIYYTFDVDLLLVLFAFSASLGKTQQTDKGGEYLFNAAHYSNVSCLSIIFIALFIAMCTKSAQFPFSSWLINAMIAPTPISALLHSSTMVIAGLYLGLKVFSYNILALLSNNSSLLILFKAV